MLQLALTHDSIDRRVGRNYNRLEFLGDAFFGFLVDLALNKQSCTTINILRSDLTSNKTAAKWANLTQLSDLINSNVEFGASSKINADAFEAFLGCWAKRLFREVGTTKGMGPSLAEHFEDWELLTQWFSQLVDLTIKQKKVIGQCTWSVGNPHLDKSKEGAIPKGRKCHNTPKAIRKFSASEQIRNLGSTFINLCITLLICENYPMIAEGDLTNLRIKIYQTLSYGDMAESFPSKNPLTKIFDQQKPDRTVVTSLVGTHIKSSTSLQDQLVRLHVLKKWIFCQVAPNL